MVKGAYASAWGGWSVLVLVFLGWVQSNFAWGADSLSSWNEGAAKQAIFSFVDKVSGNGSPEYIPPADRIAVFDGDGTLWPEKPLPLQLYFTINRIESMAPDNAHWKKKEPMASILKGDYSDIFAGGKSASLDLIMATHWGKTTDEFEAIVEAWVSSAVHPQTQLPFTEMVYQPMVELVAYLRSHSFKIYIITEDAVEFIRPWVAHTYGISPNQVIGSVAETEFRMRGGEAALVRLQESNTIGDKKDRPVAINEHVGQRPIAAFGNSDGDIAMLRWATSGKEVSLGLLLRHTDAEREWAYDRNSSNDILDRGLVVAKKQGWTVVDMKKDWKTVYLETVAKDE